MIEPLTRPEVMQKVAAIAAELDQLRKTNPELVGTTNTSLKSLSTADLRDRYWHLWLCNNPHFGIPASWRAPKDNSPLARKIRNVRKNEMLRIARIVTEEREEELKAGDKYEDIFATEKTLVAQVQNEINSLPSVPATDLVPA